MRNIQKEIDAYAKEISPEYKLFLDVSHLIDGHRKFRERNMDLQQCRQQAYDDAHAAVLKSYEGRGVIYIDQLVGMTMQDIMELICMETYRGEQK